MTNGYATGGTTWLGRSLGEVVAIATREPGKVLAAVLALHLLVWTLLPMLVSPNLQLDLVEDLALGKEWQLGYWKHPPLPWWLADLLYRATGSIDVDLSAGAARGRRLSARASGCWRAKSSAPFQALIGVLALEGIHFYNFSVVKFAHDQMQLPFWAFTGLFFYRAIVHGRMFDWMLAGALSGRRVLVEIRGRRACGDFRL